MNRNGRVCFDSYDRFFPNQDVLPEGGFGNLIALPLQGKARRMNNSVFVDDDFLPYQDQWAYLYQVKKRSILVTLLKELSGNSIEIVILTKTKDEQADYLAMQGLSVNVIPNLTLCCAIIDKSSVWYGSVNVLGYTSEEDNVIKVTDSTLAGELIGELYK